MAWAHILTEQAALRLLRRREKGADPKSYLRAAIAKISASLSRGGSR